VADPRGEGTGGESCGSKRTTVKKHFQEKREIRELDLRKKGGKKERFKD